MYVHFRTLSVLIGPLCLSVNAASKGHLPVVLYLLNKQQADPLVRNNWGETAYDVAAAVFEVWICEVGACFYKHLSAGTDYFPRCYNDASRRNGVIPVFPTTPLACTQLFP